jgi:hypothetical protein
VGVLLAPNCSHCGNLQVSQPAIKRATVPRPPSHAGYPLGERGIVRGRLLLLLPGMSLFEDMPAPKICSTVQEVQEALLGAMARVSHVAGAGRHLSRRQRIGGRRHSAVPQPKQPLACVQREEGIVIKSLNSKWVAGDRSGEAEMLLMVLVRAEAVCQLSVHLFAGP